MRIPSDSNIQYELMTTAPISKLVNKLAFPAIITMLISAMYNMVDTLFVSMISTQAVAASGIVFPVMSIIMGLGSCFGIGAASYISRLLGKKDVERANQTLSTSCISTMIIGSILALTGLLFLEDILLLLGSTDSVLPYARDYATYLLLAAPFYAASLMLDASLRAEGKPVLSMIGILTGAVLNIALDPLFIFVFDMGITGASIATALSQVIGFVLLLYFYLSKRTVLNIRFKTIRLKWTIYDKVLSVGSTTLVRNILLSIATIILNFAAKPFGDSALAALSVCSRLTWLVIAIIIGYGQGYQPVAGFNYGASRLDRVWQGFWHSIKICVIIAITAALVLSVLAQPIMIIFSSGEPETVRIGVDMIRVQSSTFVLSAWITIVTVLFQAIGKGLPALFLSAGRQGIFFIAAVLTLPALFGFAGVLLCQPVADLITFLISIPLSVLILKNLRLVN